MDVIKTRIGNDDVLVHIEFQVGDSSPLGPQRRLSRQMDGLQWAIQCNERTKALSLPTKIRSNLLVSQWIMGGLIHPKQTIRGFISEEIMQESSFFEYLDEYFEDTKGKELYQRGARETAIKNLFATLESRFDDGTVQVLKPAVENIQDLQRLDELFHEALRAETFEGFARVLSMNGDEQ